MPFPSQRVSPIPRNARHGGRGVRFPYVTDDGPRAPLTLMRAGVRHEDRVHFRLTVSRAAALVGSVRANSTGLMRGKTRSGMP